MELRIEGLRHAYGDLRVLEDIDLTVRPGEILCLVGPSGCGKSTLLRFAGGLERPEQGCVLQFGDPPPESLNPITYVFQHFALLPWRTVSGNIALVLEDHALSSRDKKARIADVLDRTRLSALSNVLPKQLSGGMRQRVALARALVVEPALLLMDEPLSSLDAQTRELMIEGLTRLYAAKPFSAIYVTHNLSEAVRLGHRIALLTRRPGRIRAIEELITPLEARTTDDPGSKAMEKRLWEAIRDEALAADRELLDG